MRYGVRSIATQISNVHPLQRRLEQWDATQDELKFAMQRRIYGLHAPARVQMERSLVAGVQRLPILRSSNLCQDIISNRDETIDFEDFLGGAPTKEMPEVHVVMERQLGISSAV